MRTALFALLVLLAPGEAAPADGAPLREAESENGRFLLRISPGRHEGRACSAMLRDRKGENRKERVRWRAALVNEIAPVHALVRDDGAFVVSLDEFRRGGAAHAVVVYDRTGKPVREFDLRELLDADDWPHVRIERHALVWLDDAEFGFSDGGDEFVINLKWGERIRIDLERGKRVGKVERPIDERDAAIPPAILALLDEATVQSRPSSGDAASTQERVARALEAIRDLEAIQRGSAGPTDASTAADGGTADDAPLPTAGLSEAAGLPIPAPRPEDPVDYLAWLNRFTAVQGDGAAPLFEQAVSLCVRHEFDDELLDAALAGDPAALSDPTLQAWLEANAEALRLYRDATQREYNGWPMKSADGSLIGALLPMLGPMRELTRVALVQGKVLEGQGRQEEAVELYFDALNVGAQAGRGLTIIENLVGLAIQKQASDALLDALAAYPETLDYESLNERLGASYQPVRPPVQAVQTERAMFLDAAQRMYDFNPETGRYRLTVDGREWFVSITRTTGGDQTISPLEQVAPTFLLGGFRFEDIVQSGNQQYDRLTEAMTQPYRQAQESLAEQERLMDSRVFQMANPLLRLLMPSLKRYHQLATRGETQRRATRVIAELKAYRRQYGQYPDSLAALADDETIDPLGEAPFVYYRDGDDFVLYSIGLDGVDDGGLHDPRGEQGDLRFWPRPAR
jgi:hypothetical protein